MGIFLSIILGLCLGSFIHAAAHRMTLGQPWINTRSRCDRCKHTLAWYDLIPLFSFLLLRGRCRYCHKPIAVGHVVSEIVSAVLVLSAWFLVQNQVLSSQFSVLSNFIIYTGVFVSLWGLLIADYYYYLLPDQLMLSFFIFTLLRLLTSLMSNSNVSPITYHLSLSVGTGLLNALLFILLILMSKGKGMGWGDVKLVFIIGLFLGFPLGLFAIYLAFLTGGLIAAILVIAGKKKFGQIIPFGPFLIVSTYFCTLFGNQLLIWLSKIF